MKTILSWIHILILLKPFLFLKEKERSYFLVQDNSGPHTSKHFSFYLKKPKVMWSRTAHMIMELEVIHHVTWREAIANTRKLDTHSYHSEYGFMLKG